MTNPSTSPSKWAVIIRPNGDQPNRIETPPGGSSPACAYLDAALSMYSLINRSWSSVNKKSVCARAIFSSNLWWRNGPICWLLAREFLLEKLIFPEEARQAYNTPQRGTFSKIIPNNGSPSETIESNNNSNMAPSKLQQNPTPLTQTLAELRQTNNYQE